MSLLSNGDGLVDHSSTNGKGGADEIIDHHDPHYDPIISLPLVRTKSNEEGETILVQLRAKLFRHDNKEKVWKERGTGEVKLLHNEELKTVRVVMRRDKTLKLCANHYVTDDMELKSSLGSDRAWVWSTHADISDGEPNPEVLAIRFQNAAAAQKWKDKFEEAKEIVAEGLNAIEEKKDDQKDDCAASGTSDSGHSSDAEPTEEMKKLSLKAETEKKEDEPGNNLIEEEKLPEKQQDSTKLPAQ